MFVYRKLFILLLFVVPLLQNCSNDTLHHIDAPIQPVPVVSGNTVYFSDENKMYAIDLQTGEEVSRLSSSTGLTTSPVIDNGTLYFGAENGDVVAYNAETFAKIWQFDTDTSIYSKPTIENDNLYFGSSSHVYALNKNNGTLVWQHKLPASDEGTLSSSGVMYSTATIDEKNVYIGTEAGVLHVLNKSTGEKQWSFNTDDGIEYTADVINTSALLDDGVIYVTELKFLLHALDSETEDKLWSFKADLASLSSPVMDENNIYFSTWASGNIPSDSTNSTNSTIGELYAVKKSNGEEVWRLPYAGFSAAPTVNNNHVYIGTWDGKMLAIDSSNGKIVWVYDTGNILPGQALISDNVLLFSSYYCLEGTCTGTGQIDNHASVLIALDKQTGQEIWKFSAQK